MLEEKFQQINNVMLMEIMISSQSSPLLVLLDHNNLRFVLSNVFILEPHKMCGLKTLFSTIMNSMWFNVVKQNKLTSRFLNPNFSGPVGSNLLGTRAELKGGKKVCGLHYK